MCQDDDVAELEQLKQQHPDIDVPYNELLQKQAEILPALERQLSLNVDSAAIEIPPPPPPPPSVSSSSSSLTPSSPQSNSMGQREGDKKLIVHGDGGKIIKDELENGDSTVDTTSSPLLKVSIFL